MSFNVCVYFIFNLKFDGCEHISLTTSFREDWLLIRLFLQVARLMYDPFTHMHSVVFTLSLYLSFFIYKQIRVSNSRIIISVCRIARRVKNNILLY